MPPASCLSHESSTLCCIAHVQDNFVIGIFLEKWRESEEYDRRQLHYEKRQSPYGPSRPDDGGDPYDGGGSADCFYDNPVDEPQPTPAPQLQDHCYVRVRLNVRWLGRSVAVKLHLPKVDYENDYEQMCESELARQERISRAAGRPWHEVPEDAVWAGHHWTDYIEDRWSKGDALQEACTRMEGVQRCNQPPPYRDEPVYGPRAGNPSGDTRFRKDRMAWYETVTGESLKGLPLAKQWQRADRVARAFRAHTRDGRSGRSSES